MICWRSAFFNLFRIVGFQTRDNHHQAVIILSLETVEEDLLRGVMVVTLNQMFCHRHLKRNLLARFAALVFPPGFQAVAAEIGAR
ncbi:hypothetical protein HR12_15085 [Microbacterium sp. SUBG005]|nr:hypothetical protein HR12_15085 [Microbacterium sp. SUBG005]